MKEVTLTELRRNIFRLVDEALETGEPIVFSRRGERVIIRPDRPMSHAEATEAWLDARWRQKFGDAPSEINEGLTLQEIEEAGEAYWQPADPPDPNP
jgi:hypothetical protein